MSKNLKCQLLTGIFSKKAELYILFCLIFLITLGLLPIFHSKISDAKTEEVLDLKNQVLAFSETEMKIPVLTIIQDNSLIASTSPKITKKVLVAVVTGYSSTTWQTDDTPEITASNSRVREGIVANNLLPFGTKVRMPEVFGNKVFVVEDRMNLTKGDLHFDIWFPSTEEALQFGAKITEIEIIEEG